MEDLRSYNNNSLFPFSIVYFLNHNVTNLMHFLLWGDSSAELFLWPSLRIWEEKSIFYVFLDII